MGNNFVQLNKSTEHEEQKHASISMLLIINKEREKNKTNRLFVDENKSSALSSDLSIYRFLLGSGPESIFDCAKSEAEEPPLFTTCK